MPEPISPPLYHFSSTQKSVWKRFWLPIALALLLLIGTLAAFILSSNEIGFFPRGWSDETGCTRITNVAECTPQLCTIVNERCVPNTDTVQSPASSCTASCSDADGCLCSQRLGCHITDSIAFGTNCGGETQQGSNRTPAPTDTANSAAPAPRLLGCGESCLSNTDCAPPLTCSTTPENSFCYARSCDGLPDSDTQDAQAAEMTPTVPNCLGITSVTPLSEIRVGRTYTFNVITDSDTTVTSVSLSATADACQTHHTVSGPRTVPGPGKHDFTWSPTTEGQVTLYATVWNGPLFCTALCAQNDGELCRHASSCTLSVTVLGREGE